MTTDDECPSGPNSLPLANLSRDAELGTADHQPEPRVRRLKELFKGQLLSLCGWILALISTVVSIAALLPAFRGQEVSEKQLELAEWTALKDYLDRCMEAFKAGLASEECKAASGLSLPPPPEFRTGIGNFSLATTSSTLTLEATGESIHLLVSLVCMIVPLLYPALRLVRYVSRMKGSIRSGDSGDYKRTPKTRQSRISIASGHAGQKGRSIRDVTTEARVGIFDSDPPVNN